MKLHYLDRSSKDGSVFTSHVHKFPFFLKVWHYHKELELVLITQSTGKYFIGDGIGDFCAGDVLLIGENLPHVWLNDKHYFLEKDGFVAESHSIHFDREFLSSYFLKLPETRKIKKLIQESYFGIAFKNLPQKIIKKIKKFPTLTLSFDKLLKFLKILYELSCHEDRNLIATEGYLKSRKNSNYENLNNLYTYIFENFKNQITLQHAADIVCMNASAFSRFFKRVNKKTFKEYLIEVRIGFACRLMLDNKGFGISRICYESGFNNVSNFNRQFKKITGYSPSHYIKIHNINNNKREYLTK